MPKRTANLDGKRVALTGRLASMTREQAKAYIQRRGGIHDPHPTKKTDFLVVGQHGWPLSDDGRPTLALRTAQELIAKGATIDVLVEEDFLRVAELFDLADEIHRLYTLSQLAGILETPITQLRRWRRLGLIQPTVSRRRLELFDFSQATSARRLAELIQRGVRPNRIKESLACLQSAIPSADLSMLDRAEQFRAGELLFRLPTGELADARGQMHFDFGDDPSAGDQPVTLAIAQLPSSGDEWIERGLRFEEDEEYEKAVDAYSQALLLEGPDPVCCYNLANALYASGDYSQAAERYRQALELDPEYVEAWNNFGNALTALRRFDLAIAAFETAIEVDPDFPDAHYNLAEALESVGRLKDASYHWRRYIEYDPASPWADHVRKRLRTAFPPEAT